MRNLVFRVSLFLAIVMMAVPGIAAAAKIDICHIPPDEPTNLHQITVNTNALNAHLGHGDHIYAEVESCNGLDDDCDGELGPGEPWVVTESEEVCDDGLDNDCDGAIDDEDDDCIVVDPQCFEPYTDLTAASRNQSFNDGNCNFGDPAGNIEICDGGDTGTALCGDEALEWQGPGWYRLSGAAGEQMPESAPSAYSCGTDAPGWLDGSHPAVLDGVVDRTACFNWAGDECNWSSDIQVVNCDGYMLYNLSNPPVSCLRYCGETLD